uniref:Alpha-mannosidase n=1 Tax=Hadrurus spadix TaxID=141984 RepID=A0A1W7RB09_9SCOR
MYRFTRRASLKFLLLTAILIAGTLIVFYHTLVSGNQKPNLQNVDAWSSDQAAASYGGDGGIWPWTSDQNEAVCSSVILTTDVNIRTTDVYHKLNFKPGFRSYWNLTFERNYQLRKKEWKDLPLKVIVLPHSHNDPGWLRTFDSYYSSLTTHILNNMADQLHRYHDMTFIWAEISFFAKWWESLKSRPHVQQRVKDMVHRNQLEIGTGGWVMTDEATAHYYSMIDQLIEGHQWLKSTLGIHPKNGWSIDPFGHSATVPYLIHEAGIENMVIQRTHFAWKQYLAERKKLEFVWKKLSASPMADLKDGKNILCHMAPFDLYSIKHTCGPDANICLQFDFRKIIGEYTESRAYEINDKNVHERAELLLGQYGRIGSLFPHNVALVPLGDDFRFNYDIEWDQQYTNYRILFDYINSQKDWYAQVDFGTLEDYFQEVHKRTKEFPSVSGDFFSYGDIYADGRPSYWTGYFTTRPFMKHLCRELEHWLRAAEILYSLTRAHVSQRGYSVLLQKLDDDYKYLSYGRDNLGLFQHHDAITGTSKETVMADYGNRLHRSLQEVSAIVSHSAQFLLFENIHQHPIEHPLTSNLFPDVERPTYDTIPKKLPFHLSPSGRKLVLYNTMGQARQEPVRVVVKTPQVKVLNSKMVPISIQINPIWNGSVDIVNDLYEVFFIAELPPLSLTTYSILESRDSQDDSYRSVVSVILNDASAHQLRHSVFKFHNPIDQNIKLVSPSIAASFSKRTGLLEGLELKKDGIETSVVTLYQAYQSREYRSGAYLFQPDPQDPFRNISSRFPVIRVVRGPLVSEVTAIYGGTMTITGRVYHKEGPLGSAVELETTYDLNQQQATEIEMYLRFITNIESDKFFYTDSNGYQMIKRVHNTELPLEANYYPITSAIYIEDSLMRFTLLVSHAHGGSSLGKGWLEVMLDRRIRFDDSRGLGEGIMDNKKTTEKFWLILEKREDTVSPDEVPNLSWLGHTLSSTLLYPSILLVSDGSTQSAVRSNITFLERPYVADTHLLNLRTLPRDYNFAQPSNNSLLILHRKAISCHVKNPTTKPVYKDGSIVSPFHHIRVHSITRTTLTGTQIIDQVKSFKDISMDAMDIKSFNITL